MSTASRYSLRDRFGYIADDTSRLLDFHSQLGRYIHKHVCSRYVDTVHDLITSNIRQKCDLSGLTSSNGALIYLRLRHNLNN